MNNPALNKPALSVALKLARRELRGGLKGFRIFLACLALGVAAIASVQSISSGVLTGLRNDGRIILGGDIAFRTLYSEISAEQSAYLAQGTRAVCHFIELRTMARTQANDASTLAEMKAVDDCYPLFGAMQLHQEISMTDALAQKNGLWGVLIDPGLQERLGVSVGDRIRLGDTEFSVRATIKREPDRAGSGGNFGFWPRVMISQTALADTGLVREGSMLYHQYRIKLPEQSDPAAYRAGLEAAFPDNAWRIRDYRNAAPRLERTIERLTLFLTLVGLTALLVGGVGVSNAVKAYLDSKLDTIATLKCLGAPGRTVFQTYLAQLLVLAGIGIAIGLSAGVIAPPVAGWLLAALLPVPIHVSIYPGALLLAALFGLLTMLTFAVWPLARAHEIPAGALFRDLVSRQRQHPRLVYIGITVFSALLLAGLAIASAASKKFAVWFVIGAIATIAAFRVTAWLVMYLTGRIKRPRRPGLRLALTNIHRPGAATPNVVLSLGLGLTVLIAIALIEGNMAKQLQDSIPEKAPSFFFVDVQSDQIDRFSDLLNTIDGTRDLMKVPFLRGRIVRIKGMDPEKALVKEEEAWMIRGDRGLTYAALAPENARIIAGQWWPQDYAGPPLLSVHKDLAEGFGVGLGDTITLNVLGRTITAEVSNIRDLEWESMQLNFAMMLSPEPLQRAPHGYVATVGASEAAENEIQRAVSREFPNITTVRIKDALDRVNELMSSVGAAVRSIAGITLLAGTLVLAGAVAAGHKRRVYESVVLKVLGATRREVLRAFMLEYGLLGLLTALIAAFIGTLASWAVLTQVMNSAWVFIPSVVLLTALLCTAITLAFGFVGTWRALGQKAAPLLRNE